MIRSRYCADMARVLAVIPTYRPEPDGLQSLVEDLYLAGLPVIVSDDASPATSDRVLAHLAASGAQVLRHVRNAGIARGLNEGLALAVARGAEWLLTMDQDSRIAPAAIAQLVEVAVSHPGIGVVGVEVIADASGDLRYPSRAEGGMHLTEEVFQTGSLWNVAALGQIGGFDERLGIDGVDAAACLRLRERAWRVVLAPRTRVEHRYGSGTRVRLLGRPVVSTGHSPQRRETMIRNRIALAPAEFRQSPRHAIRTLRRVAVNTLLGVTIEEHRLANLMGSLRGLRSRTRR